MSRSFFGDAPWSSSSVLPSSDSVLTEWVESVPLAANLNSTVAPSSPFSPSAFANRYSSHVDPLLTISRKEQYIQQSLQLLLDAQADGLIAGLTGDDRGQNASSTGSSTPRSFGAASGAASVNPKMPTQTGQPRRKLGLRAARRGILSSMHELALIKDEESHILDTQINERDLILERINAWGAKKEGLQKEIEDIRDGQGSRKLRDLKEEAGGLEREIQILEEKLAGMKAMHRALTGEISELENSVQAKLSSYTTSLSMVDSQVRRFLAQPPLKPPRDFHDQMAFLSLQPERRTLGLAKEYWRAERDFLQKKRTAAEAERDALEDGAVLWNDVITEAMAFEKRLREEMHNGGGSHTLPRHTDKDKAGQDNGSIGMKEILQMMDQTILQIESKYKLADTNGWNLLVCCIGAELEAFKEGKDILTEALETSTGVSSRGFQSQVEDQDQAASNAWLDSPAGSTSPVHHRSPERGSYRRPSVQHIDRSEDEDDEPDPELLISHQDTD